MTNHHRQTALRGEAGGSGDLQHVQSVLPLLLSLLLLRLPHPLLLLLLLLLL